MADSFNLNGLYPLFRETLERAEKSLIFDVCNGKGKFLFLMFPDEDDIDSQDKLFIYLRNIKCLIETKLYGNHRKGKFDIYIRPHQESKIKEELGIMRGYIKNPFNPFNLRDFLTDLNSSFPKTLPLRTIVNNLRKDWKIIEKLPGMSEKLIDEPNKTVLVGEKRLIVGKEKPRLKTLRKLHLYIEADSNDIENLIKCLQRANITLRWTTPDSNLSPIDIQNLLNKRY